MTDWKDRLQEILKLMGNLNATRDEVIEIMEKLQQFSKNLEEGKYTNLTKDEVRGLNEWCKTFAQYIQRAIALGNIKYN